MIKKPALFAILRTQNFWHRKVDFDYTFRPQYLNKIFEYLKSRAIVVLQGPRRVGKTVLLRLTIQNLMHSIDPKQILYVNLEDFRLYKFYSLELLDLIYSVYREEINPSGPVYFLLDEIQNIEKFEHFLRTKYDIPEETIHFIITGSNSTLLSEEISMRLTGRFVRLEIYPFSFREYLQYHKESTEIEDSSTIEYFNLEIHKAKWKHWFNRYYKNCMIPEYLENPTQERLQEYFDNIILKDIVGRFHIRNARLIKDLGIYFLSNVANLASQNLLRKTFDVSINTIKIYMEYMESAFLFFQVKKYDFSYKKQITSPRKIYCIDNGLIEMVSFKFSPNQGRLFENLVYIELKRLGYKVYYFRGKGECDFIVKDQDHLHVQTAIQVTVEMSNEITRNHEISGLIEALKELNLEEGYILTEDEYSTMFQEEFKIKIRPLWYWLLKKD